MDDSAHHLMMVRHQTIIAIGRIHANTPQQSQIRYMAVDRAYQRQGLGTQLLDALESQAKKWRTNSILLYARESAIGFYSLNGYKTIAPAHTLFDSIHHVQMMKYLS